MAKVLRLQYGVDRIEDGGWVVLEDGDARTFTVPRGKANRLALAKAR